MNTYFLLNMPLEQQEALAVHEKQNAAVVAVVDRWARKGRGGAGGGGKHAAFNGNFISDLPAGPPGSAASLSPAAQSFGGLSSKDMRKVITGDERGLSA